MGYTDGNNLSTHCVISREELWKQLENANVSRVGQDQVIWSIFGIFWAANALLLVAIFTSNLDYTKYTVTIISGVGIFTSIVWFLILHRGLSHNSLYECLMRIIEDKLFKDCPEYRLTLPETGKSKISGPRARNVMRGSVIVFLMLWLVGLGIGMCMFFRC